MTTHSRTFGTGADDFAKLMGDGESTSPTAPSTGETFTCEGEDACTLLLVNDDAMYVATATPQLYRTALDKLSQGVVPHDAFPENHTKVERNLLTQVRWQQDSRSIVFVRTDVAGSENRTEFTLANKSQVAYVISRIVALMGLGKSPSVEQASVGEITAAPLFCTSIPLLMLGGMFVVSLIVDTEELAAPRFGRAGFLKKLTRDLGPTGLLITIGVVFCVGFGYWVYRFVKRPLVKIYERRTS